MYISIPPLPHAEGLTEEEVLKQLSCESLTNFHQYENGILHANLDKIHSIECIDLKYIKAYLMKLIGVKEPLIMIQRYNPKKSSYKERFRWTPLRIPSGSSADCFRTSDGIPTCQSAGIEAIESVYKLICAHISNIDEKKLKGLLSRTHPFHYQTMSFSFGRVQSGIPEQIRVYFNADSFACWDRFVIRLLENYEDVNGFIYTDSWLNGLFLRFESQNPIVRRCSKALKRALRQNSRAELMSYIRENLFAKDKSADKAFHLEDIIAFCAS